MCALQLSPADSACPCPGDVCAVAADQQLLAPAPRGPGRHACGAAGATPSAGRAGLLPRASSPAPLPAQGCARSQGHLQAWRRVLPAGAGAAAARAGSGTGRCGACAATLTAPTHASWCQRRHRCTPAATELPSRASWPLPAGLHRRCHAPVPGWLLAHRPPPAGARGPARAAPRMRCRRSGCRRGCSLHAPCQPGLQAADTPALLQPLQACRHVSCVWLCAHTPQALHTPASTVALLEHQRGQTFGSRAASPAAVRLSMAWDPRQ